MSKSRPTSTGLSADHGGSALGRQDRGGIDRAIKMLRPEGGERVLDLDCRIGRHSRELRRRGFEVVGVDNQFEIFVEGRE